MLKPDGPHRLGRKLFNWHGSEAKLNAMFSKIVKPGAYLAIGPISGTGVARSIMQTGEVCKESHLHSEP